MAFELATLFNLKIVHILTLSRVLPLAFKVLKCFTKNRMFFSFPLTKFDGVLVGWFEYSFWDSIQTIPWLAWSFPFGFSKTFAQNVQDSLPNNSG